MKKNLYFGVLLAPYRVDYYNYLYNRLNFEIFFQLEGFEGQLFDREKLIAQSSYTPHYLKGFGREQRRICFGVNKLVKKYSPKVIIVPEFSILTIWVIILKIIFKYNYKIISQCDDSYQMLKTGGFSKWHDKSRFFCVKNIDDLILVDTKAVEWYQERYCKGIWMPIIKNESIISTDENIVKHYLDYYKNKFHPEDTNIILFVGRLVHVKNLETLIESCSLLKEKYHLLVVGDGPMHQQWKSLANGLNINCSFLGRKNDEELEAIYRTASIFVLPSKMEAFGAVTNEALLAGCMCCVSNKAGSACLIEEGVNGYTFNPCSAEDLARKITSLSNRFFKERDSLMSKSFYDYMQPLFDYISR